MTNTTKSLVQFLLAMLLVTIGMTLLVNDDSIAAGVGVTAVGVIQAFWILWTEKVL